MPRSSGIGDDAGVHIRRRGGEGEDGAVEVDGGVGFGAPVEGGMGFVGGAWFKADEADTGAGGEGGGGLAPADGAAADHEDEAIGQVEEEGEHGG